MDGFFLFLGGKYISFPRSIFEYVLGSLEGVYHMVYDEKHNQTFFYYLPLGGDHVLSAYPFPIGKVFGIYKGVNNEWL